MVATAVKITGVSLVVLLAALAGGAWWIAAWLDTPLALRSPVDVEIHQGQAFAVTADQLAKSGITHRPRLLTAYARITGIATRVQAGEYRIEPGQTLSGVLEAMAGGVVISYQLTLVEGWTLDQVLTLLSSSAKLDHQLDGVEAAGVMASLGLEGEHGEGWFFPDTYGYTRGTSDRTLLLRAHEQMRKTLAAAWEERDAGLPFDSPYEVLIMASIVEKETGREEERGKVARVFINRLQRGMALQTDPTVIYGLGRNFDGNLTRVHLNTDGPYNTYRRKGLPPTPIALPSRRSIEAVVHPEAGEYLYFVARGDGTSQFSHTLDEHLAAVRRYQLKRKP
jgi:UPF0755 protein